MFAQCPQRGYVMKPASLPFLGFLLFASAGVPSAVAQEQEQPERAAILRCTFGPDGGVEVQNVSISLNAAIQVVQGQDCAAATLSLMEAGMAPAVDPIITTVGSEISLILLLGNEDEEDRGGAENTDGSDNEGDEQDNDETG